MKKTPLQDATEKLNYLGNLASYMVSLNGDTSEKAHINHINLIKDLKKVLVKFQKLDAKKASKTNKK